MSVSPQLDPLPSATAPDPRSPQINPVPSPTSLANSSNPQLATLLTDTFREVDTLRRELSIIRRRAEKAERLLQSFQAVSGSASPGSNATQPLPESVTRIIVDLEDRAARAEFARDEAEARRRMMTDNWQQLDRYLSIVEIRAADARAGFTRIVADGGGPLVLAHIPLPGSSQMPPPASIGSMAPPVIHPTRRHAPQGPASREPSLSQRSSNLNPAFPSITLPPHPSTNPSTGSRVRPRAGSLDGSGYLESVPGQPPNKKSRNDRDERRGREGRPTFADSPYHSPYQSHPPAQQFPRSPQSHHLLPPQSHYPHHTPDPREREYLEQQRLQGSRHATHHQHPQHPSQPRMILPPGEKYPRRRSRSGSRPSHSRSSSRSSASSTSFDEMLLRTAGEEHSGVNGNGAAPGGTPPPPDLRTRPAHRHRHHHREREGQRPLSPHSQSHLQSRHPHPSESQLYAQHQQQQQSQHPSQQRTAHLDDSPPYQSQATAPSSSYRSRGAHSSATLVADGTASGPAGPLPQPGQVQTYQTHVFAPVVTGAPVKKSKFSSNGGSLNNVAANSTASVGSLGPVDAPPPAPPIPAFPATNQQGQRICRQCGLPGRYKEGKCVEKWGPGPMGPGTVCDRCRKKMKRVERRGTLENQQGASSNSIASISGHQPQQQQPPLHRNNTHSAVTLSLSSDRPIHRSDTIISHQGQIGPGGTHLTFSQSDRNRDRERDRDRDRDDVTLRPVSVSSIGPAPSSKSYRHPPSPPAIATLSPEDPRGRGVPPPRPRSRSNSRNGRATRGSRPTPPRADSHGGPGVAAAPSKRSPLGSGSSGVGKGSQRASISPNQMDIDGENGDVDADADADAEVEAETQGATEGEGTSVEVDAEADADAEADLLEAVDAAEANSSGSASVGWLKSEDA